MKQAPQGNTGSTLPARDLGTVRLAEMFAKDLDHLESCLGRLGDLRRAIDI